MPPLDEQFALTLHGAASEWRKALTRRLRDIGVGQAGWLAIAAVAKFPAPPSQAELADRLGVEAATVVSTVDRLVRAGYAERQTSPSDRRVKFVVLTDPGRAVYHEVKQVAEGLRAELLLGLDDATLAQITQVLDAIQTRAMEA